MSSSIGRTDCRGLLLDGLCGRLRRQFSLCRHVRRLCVRPRPRRPWTRRDRPPSSSLQHGATNDLLFPRRARWRVRPSHMHAARIKCSTVGRLGRRRRAYPCDRCGTADDLHGAAILRAAAGFSSPGGRLCRQHICSSPAQPARGAGPHGAAGLRRLQRLSPVSPSLCLRRPGGEQLPTTRRCPYHGVVWTGDLPCDAHDGRHWPDFDARVAATRCDVCRRLHSGARHSHPRPRASCPWLGTRRMLGLEAIQDERRG